jgi:uncharacterized protein YndB with AHSA1/START domain
VTEIRLNLYYPHPPERVWRAITDSRAIASWLMENDFAPRIGHRFHMRPAGLPGFDGLIDGEVTEIVPLSQVRMTWRSGEVVADVTWVVKMAPGGSSMQIVHNGELGSDLAGADRHEALEQTYAVIFEQHLPLVLHDFAIEAGAASGLVEGLPVTPAEGKDRPLEFPAALEMDWVSAGQSSGPIAGAAYAVSGGGYGDAHGGGGAYGGAVSGGGAYGGSLYGSAAGGPPSSPVIAMPQVGSEHAWGNDISPPSGVSLGDGLSLSGYWSSDGSGFGAHGVPLNPAAAAAAERQRTRNLIMLSVGSLVAVLVFVFGAWAAFSNPSSPRTPGNAPNTGDGTPGVGVVNPVTGTTPTPGGSKNPSDPIGQGNGNPTAPDGSGGGNGNPNPQLTSNGGGTSTTPPPSVKPLVARVHPNRAATSAQAPYPAWVFTVTIKNPGTEDVGGWTLELQLAEAGLRGKVDDGIRQVHSGNRVQLSSAGAFDTIPAGETISFHVLLEGTDPSVVVNCAVNKKDAQCGVW